MSDNSNVSFSKFSFLFLFFFFFFFETEKFKDVALDGVKIVKEGFPVTHW